MKERWINISNKFLRQPGNKHLLVAGAMLITLALVIAMTAKPTSQENSGPTVVTYSQQDHDLPRSAVPALPNQFDTPPIIAPGQEPSMQEPSTQGPSTQEPSTQDLAAPEPSAQQLAIAIDSDPRPKLVIILDDIGNNAESGNRAIALPGAITYAVLPYTPHGKMLAEQAFKANKEIMLHAPMSNISGMALGPGGLTMDMNEEDFIQALRNAIADIPHITGINNHTGSELTAALLPMQWVMLELKNQGLFFVDSMTTSDSVAEATAIAHHVPVLRRHVFLDNTRSEEAIHSEFQRALNTARQQGYAVAIGHPYPETLSYLEQALPALEAQGVQLVSVSELIKTKEETAH